MILEASDRPMRLLDDLTRPEDPFGLLLLLVNHHKALMLRQLSGKPVPAQSRRRHGEIHLTVSSLADGMQRPVIVADGSLPSRNRLPTVPSPGQCHEANLARAMGKEELVFWLESRARGSSAHTVELV